MDEKEKNIVIKAINAHAKLERIIGQPYTEGELYELVDGIRPLVDRWIPKMMYVGKLKSDVKIGCAIFKKGTTVIAKCPTCGNWVKKSDKYCRECGQALASDERGKFLSWVNAREWGKIYDPMLEKEVMTYCSQGAPAFDSYTAPFMNDDGDIVYHRFDHDAGGWTNITYYLMEGEEYRYLRLIGKELEFRL